ncbi:F-box/kelch-repeat protein At3g23880-like [Silene latifolia]|uniref:F-box/kelch-repeat protein At3g23880-like n=1 Tax=Silene latifolia TaxID=37657 RepID=UPI003D77CF8A
MGDKQPNSDNKKQQSCFFDDLIIQEILTRLPIKSIIRFKSVSKQWYSTLSSSNFANAHLIKSPFSHPSAPVDTLLIKCGNNFYLSSCDDDQISGNFQNNLVKLDAAFGVEENSFRLIGCCNGLICLTLTHDNYFIIWNPATHKMHKYESDGYLNGIDFSGLSIVVRGFGYASSVDDYKYVLIVYMPRENEKGNIVHIFSLKEKKWRKIDFDHDMVIPEGGAVLVNEKLYMIAFLRIDFGSRLVVVSFDLGLETFEITNKFNIDGLDILGVMGGCLSIINGYTQNPFMHIQESPTTMKSICLPKELCLINLSSEIIGFTKSGKCFVTAPVSDDNFWDSPSRELWLVDTVTKPMGYSMLMKEDEGLNIVQYVPSLVSPFPVEELSEA